MNSTLAMRTLLALASGLGLAACGEKDIDDSATDDTEIEVPPFEPSAGTYDVETTDTVDECNFPDDGTDTGVDESSTIALDAVDVDARTFTITLDDENASVYACSWSDDLSFSCEATVLGTQDLADLGMDALITTTGTVTGTLEAASNSGQQSIDVTCEGVDCAGLADFGFVLPCNITGSFVATLQE